MIISKRKILSITGIIIGFLASVYSYLGLLMVGSLSFSPGYTAERKQYNLHLWGTIFLISSVILIISLISLWFLRNKKK